MPRCGSGRCYFYGRVTSSSRTTVVSSMEPSSSISGAFLDNVYYDRPRHLVQSPGFGNEITGWVGCFLQLSCQTRLQRENDQPIRLLPPSVCGQWLFKLVTMTQAHNPRLCVCSHPLPPFISIHTQSYTGRLLYGNSSGDLKSTDFCESDNCVHLPTWLFCDFAPRPGCRKILLCPNWERNDKDEAACVDQ